jgi:hypothetical protein
MCDAAIMKLREKRPRTAFGGIYFKIEKLSGAFQTCKKEGRAAREGTAQGL